MYTYQWTNVLVLVKAANLRQRVQCVDSWQIELRITLSHRLCACKITRVETIAFYSENSIPFLISLHRRDWTGNHSELFSKYSFQWIQIHSFLWFFNFSGLKWWLKTHTLFFLNRPRPIVAKTVTLFKTKSIVLPMKKYCDNGWFCTDNNLLCERLIIPLQIIFFAMDWGFYAMHSACSVNTCAISLWFCRDCIRRAYKEVQPVSCRYVVN